jgi:phosphoenolpyruvate-protein kinase (PTS system EI component)
LLLGLGVEELSVSPKILPKVGQVIRSLNYGQCHALAENALRESRSQRILDMSLELAKRCYPDLLD